MSDQNIQPAQQGAQQTAPAQAPPQGQQSQQVIKPTDPQEIAAALVKALDDRTQRAERGVMKSFTEQYGISETELASIVDERKKAQLLKDVDVKQSGDYQALQKELDTFKAKVQLKDSEDFKSVKGKFFDAVYDKLDHEKPYPEQLTAMQKDYEEYFVAEKPPATVSSGMKHTETDAQVDAFTAAAMKGAGLTKGD